MWGIPEVHVQIIAHTDSDGDPVLERLGVPDGNRVDSGGLQH